MGLEEMLKLQELIGNRLALNNSVLDFQKSIIKLNSLGELGRLQAELAGKANQSAIAYSKNLSLIFQSQHYLNYLTRLEKILNIDFEKLSIPRNLGSSFKAYNYDFLKVLETRGRKGKKEASLEKIVVTEAARIRKILLDIYLNNEKLYQLDPRGFEKVVAELLSNQGFDIGLTKQTRDHGYDILALKSVKGLSPVKYLVECKRYRKDRKVGVEIVRSFKEVICTEQANKGLIVTTSYFSRDAIKKREETPLLLDYKDKDELMEWINDYFESRFKG